MRKNETESIRDRETHKQTEKDTLRDRKEREITQIEKDRDRGRERELIKTAMNRTAHSQEN